MHARVSTYRSEDADQLVTGFEAVREELEHMDGFSHAYFLVDKQSGKGISMTLWHTEEALEASVARADELRKKGTEIGRGSTESVQHYEVRMTAGTPAAV